jgi:hypothetical protein
MKLPSYGVFVEYFHDSGGGTRANGGQADLSGHYVAGGFYLTNTPKSNSEGKRAIYFGVGYSNTVLQRGRPFQPDREPSVIFSITVMDLAPSPKSQEKKP